MEALGISLVQRLDATSALAMWSDTNENYAQQRIIKKYMWHHFGKWLFIPEIAFSEDNDFYTVPTFYSECRYYKNDNKMQKLE